MSKVDQVHQILGQRLLHGDYLFTEVPAERELAQEIGTSRMTARKALQRLLEEGQLEREANGRLVAGLRRGSPSGRIGLMVPSVASQDVEFWRLHLERIAAERGIALQTTLYVHWDDPVLLRGLDVLEAVFLYPSCEPLPERLVERFREKRRKVVFLEQDLSAHGIPSICLMPSRFVQRLLDQMLPWATEGLDCFNVQTLDPTITARLQQWRLWGAAHAVPGQLWGEPIEPYAIPIQAAYAQMGALLKAGRFRSRALLCTTAPAALGAMRALRDHGREVGRDVAVCVINDEQMGRYTCPSLTALVQPDPAPYLRVSLDWLTRPERPWVGSLLLEPAEPSLFLGESTGAGRGAASG